MKALIFILLFSGNLFSQTNTIIGNLILSDSLYNKTTSPYSFQKDIGGFGYNVDLSEVQDINDYLKIENNQLKFMIKHGGGCKTAPVQAKLVYNGIEYLDSAGTSYYIVKFIFFNADPCQAIKHKYLIFDISAISGHRVKFYGFNHYIN